MMAGGIGKLDRHCRELNSAPPRQIIQAPSFSVLHDEFMPMYAGGVPTLAAVAPNADINANPCP